MREKRFKNFQFKLLMGIAILLYIPILMKLTVFPYGGNTLSAIIRGMDINTVSYSLIPFKEIIQWITSKDLIVLAKIALFIPFGYFVSIKGNKKTVVLLGLGLSVLLEGIQFLIHTGNFQVDTILLNTLGVLCGASIYKAMEKAPERKRQMAVLFFILMFLFTFLQVLDRSEIYGNSIYDWGPKMFSVEESDDLEDNRELLGIYNPEMPDVVGEVVEIDEEKQTVTMESDGILNTYGFQETVTIAFITETMGKQGEIKYWVQDFSRDYEDYSVEHAMGFIKPWDTLIKFYEGKEPKIELWLNEEGKIACVATVYTAYKGILR